MKSNPVLIAAASMALACSLLGCSVGGGTPPVSYPPLTTEAEWMERTAPLRPPGAEESLKAAAKDPKDPTVYATLADDYAGSDSPVMAIGYGLYFRAMGTDCASDRVAAMAVARVLAQKLSVSEDPQGNPVAAARLDLVSIPEKSLAQGKRAASLGVLLAQTLERSVPGYKENTILEFSELLGRWIEAKEALGSFEELRAWLRATRDAGHLLVFSYQLLGPAYPDEFKKFQRENDAAIKAAQEYFDTHLLVPTRTPRADDAVPTP